MKTDINRLKGKIVENGLSGAKMANEIGVNQSTYYRKLNEGGGSFTISQAQKIAELLCLSPKECNAIFFGR